MTQPTFLVFKLTFACYHFNDYAPISTISHVRLRSTKTNMEQSNNFVIIENDQTIHKCTAKLNNFFFHTQKLEVGQSITSQIFEMNCPKIGKSRWKLILFPAGQYEFERDNGQLSVYLKMIACENENEKLLADVKFFTDSEDKFSKVVLASTFSYKNTKTRWVGVKLVSISELNTRASYGYLLQENNLVIGCRMIHSAFVNDEPKCIVQDSVQLAQPWKLKDVHSNSLMIDVNRLPDPYSSPSSVLSHNGTEDSPENSTTTFSTTSNYNLPRTNFV